MQEPLHPHKKTTCQGRRRRQWWLSLIVFVVIGLGWWWPYLGFAVPLTMAAGMIGGLSGGRWVCGNLCPRGSFWDRHFSLIVKHEKPSPAWLKNLFFRWVVFVALIAFMFYRAGADITSPAHWGRVFWLMCTVTTCIGIIGGFAYHRRFWCIFCPIGTFAATVSGHKHQLRIADKTCISCHACDRACPIGINPEQYRSTGRIADRDCLRCEECIDACPTQSIGKDRDL
ncbi:MAG: 4Fe-4S dicluster domain-containing protein [Deltaproteobacteria bacterium]|nr:4Fe-4S dicluster domain-containing protein [Deltaproteobacteria bacterium]